MKTDLNISTENNLTDEAYLQKLHSFYLSGGGGFINGVNEVNIFYKIFLQPGVSEKSIVISNGRSESVIKYKELIWDLFNNGYSVFAIDHRGQGFSDRLIKEKPQLGYVDSFENYVTDLKSFYDEIVKANSQKNIFLLAHSMGGAIGLRYLEKFPDDFAAAGFTSPMLGIPFPNCILIRFIFGKDSEFARGETDYDSANKEFENNQVTNSKIRYELALREFENNPSAKLGGAGYRWVKEACKANRYIFREASEIKTPLLLLQGTDEMIVDPKAHKKFINILRKKNKEFENVVFNGARHELLFEKDEFRIPALKKILEFFDLF